MRVFNRVVLILILGGLAALGVCAVVYAMNVGEYRLEDLPRALGLASFYEGLRGFVENVENGNMNPLSVAVLVAIALLGLILLVLELKPRTPRRVRMQRGTYITRNAVQDEATAVADQEPEVLQSSVNVKAKRGPGAKVTVRASVRPGENNRSVQSEVRDQVQQHMARIGIPVSNLKIRVVESDPRETKTRVK